MEIIILMSWSIWKCRNGWIFENIPPTTDSCKEIFVSEMLLMVQRSKSKYEAVVVDWLEQFPP